MDNENGTKHREKVWENILLWNYMAKEEIKMNVSEVVKTNVVNTYYEQYINK